MLYSYIVKKGRSVPEKILAYKKVDQLYVCVNFTLYSVQCVLKITFPPDWARLLAGPGNSAGDGQ
jgi:hypothetical protein